MTDFIENAIVIGSTGLVGKMLLKQLNEHPKCHKITAIVRTYQPELERLHKVQQFDLNDLFMLNDEDVGTYSHAFSCLGTTLKKAGSKAKFYNVDYEMNAHFADLLVDKPIQLILVSALGARVNSPLFYSRVKGELEEYVKTLNLFKLSILQPSLLLGTRHEQRIVEGAIQSLYQRMSHFVPNTFKYKPVTAEQVAHTMVEAALRQTDKIEIYDNLRIQTMK